MSIGQVIIDDPLTATRFKAMYNLRLLSPQEMAVVKTEHRHHERLIPEVCPICEMAVMFEPWRLWHKQDPFAGIRRAEGEKIGKAFLFL